LKEKNPAVQAIGVQPKEGSQIPGIRKWPNNNKYLPKIYTPENIDRIELVSQSEAEEATRRLAREEGIIRRHFCRRRHAGGTEDQQAGEARDHRVHRLQSRRRLSFNGRVSELSRSEKWREMQVFRPQVFNEPA
jgi:hypothetical protein